MLFRSSAETLHVVEISQVADTSSGSHRFQFSDPRYIANEAGREYHIHLDPHKPMPDIVNLESTSTADPRYQKTVDDFERSPSVIFWPSMATMSLPASSASSISASVAVI